MADTPLPTSPTSQGTPPRDAGAMALSISETFVSLQGEGVLTGVPSLFIRTAGCNLRCGWCDTPYASWNPDGAPRTIASLVDEAKASGVRHVVLTGGEPMLPDAIEPLTQALRGLGMHITIETAGTIHRPPARLACDLMSISPKLSTSTPVGDPRDPEGVWQERHEQRRIDPRVLGDLLRSFDQVQLKFVACDPKDLAEIETILKVIPAVRPERVLLMPEGTAPHGSGATDWVVRACIERGWRYCHRAHIDLFGNTRGT